MRIRKKIQILSWTFGLKVAIAVICDEANQILITQRPFHATHGGCWEFPGGKVEPHESPEGALKREIKEELGIELNHSKLIGEIQHQYPEYCVQLLIFLVSEFSGTPQCLEGQLGMKWVPTAQLNPNDFPAANRDIFPLIQARTLEPV